MAAPPSKTLKDLNGKWVMNKSISSNPEPGLQLQGIGLIVRKAVGVATITLSVKEYEGPPSPPNEDTATVTHIDIEQSASNWLKGTTELRCLDYNFREHSDWMFGHVRGQTKWIATADITDEFLKTGWIEDEAEKVGPAGESHILSYVESLDNSWTATQIWGFELFDGERRYSRHIVVAKDSERVELKLVYDYLP